MVEPLEERVPNFHKIDERSFREAMEFARRRYGELDWNVAEFIGWTPRVIVPETWFRRIRSIPKGLVFVIIPKKNGQPIKERFGNEERIFGIMIKIPLPLDTGSGWQIWEKKVEAKPAFVKVVGETNEEELTKAYFNVPELRYNLPYYLTTNDPQIIRMLRMREDYLREVRRLRERQRMARR